MQFPSTKGRRYDLVTAGLLERYCICAVQRRDSQKSSVAWGVVSYSAKEKPAKLAGRRGDEHETDHVCKGLVARPLEKT